jgi:hypothetical protein
MHGPLSLPFKLIHCILCTALEKLFADRGVRIPVMISGTIVDNSGRTVRARARGRMRGQALCNAATLHNAAPVPVCLCS